MLISKTLPVSLLALLVGSSALLGCSSDDKKTAVAPATGNDGGGGGGSGEGGACDVTLKPSDDDQTAVQGALAKLKSSQTVCFSAGTYKFTNHISLSAAQGITFRGTGAKPEDTLFDFTGQTAGSEGVLVTTDDFTIENLWIKNTQGNGIKVEANRSVFRHMKVSWEGTGSGGSRLTGAYGIYPVKADHTLVEDNEVSGAIDAGIYAGQCKHVIARNNNSHDNVLGLEVENTIGAEVYGNDLHDNTTGMLLDLLQGLDQTISKDYLVHDNDIHDNNLPSFAGSAHAADGGTTSLITIAPQGTGVLIYTATNVEFRNNEIRNNGGAALVIMSQTTADLVALAQGGTPQKVDPNTPDEPEKIYVHDNTFTNNGTAPTDIWALVDPSDGGVQSNPYEVQWDGVRKAGVTNDTDMQICLGKTNLPTFVNFHAPDGLAGALNHDYSKWTTDTTDHECELPAVPPLTP